MNYYEMIRQISGERLAIVEDGRPYTYRELMALTDRAAEKILNSRDGAACDKNLLLKRIFFIKEDRIIDQLVSFLAAQKLHRIPVILPYAGNSNDPWMEEGKTSGEISGFCEPLKQAAPDEDAICMGVCTSGSKGIPKLYFRTYESWAEYFPIQNEIFGVSKDSRLFAQGSLSFTGNLNLYMAQFSVGATVIAQNAFMPKNWLSTIETWKPDVIYLIPGKLACLKKAAEGERYDFVKNILSGSQSMGKAEADSLKSIFPDSRVILYYGASELNYITYLTDQEMTEEKNLVGKAFPDVNVMVDKGEIYVDTKYHVWGISCPYTLSDTGYFDQENRLHFTGRSDDVIGVRGRKVSTYRIEQKIMELEEVEEAAVVADEKEHLICYVKSSAGVQEELCRKKIYARAKEGLDSFEIPRKIIFIENMPKNASGKIDKKLLGDYRFPEGQSNGFQ